MAENRQVPVQRQSFQDHRVPWSIRDALYGFALVIAVGLVTLAVLGLLLDQSRPDGIHPLVTLVLGLFQVLFFVVVWALAIRRYQVPWRSVGFASPQGRRSYLLASLVVFASLTFAVLYAVVMTAAGSDFLVPDPIPERALGEGAFRLATIGIIGIMGPLAEEVFFRGFLLAAMIRPLGAPRAMAVGSAIFAASHFSIGALVPLFVTGWLLSWLYLKTRSIWPPFAAHAAQNFIAVFAISAAG